MCKFLWGHIVISLRNRPRRRLAGSRGDSVSNSEEPSKCFPKWLPQFCFPTSSMWAFWLHIFTNTCNCLFFIIMRELKITWISLYSLYDGYEMRRWGKPPSSPLHAGSSWSHHPGGPALRGYQGVAAQTWSFPQSLKGSQTLCPTGSFSVH